jgi:hypothetical protein
VSPGEASSRRQLGVPTGEAAGLRVALLRVSTTIWRSMTKLLALSLVAGMFTTASAESLEEKQYWKKEMNYMQRSLESANKRCGTTFTFEFVGKPKFREETEKTNHSPYGVCDILINQVEMICRSGDDAKQAVAEKFKGFECGFAKPRTLDVKGGIVRYMGNNLESNVTDWMKPWLLKRL